MKQPNGPQQPNDNQAKVKADIITPAEKPIKQNKTKIRFKQNLDTAGSSVALCHKVNHYLNKFR